MMPASISLSIAGKELGYIEGYKFLQNHKILIMSVLRVFISALWRRYSWFESMRGSQIDLDRKVDRAALEAVWCR
jgi:hypothetical protein